MPTTSLRVRRIHRDAACRRSRSTRRRCAARIRGRIRTRTLASAASIACRFSGTEKSAYGSLRKSESVAVAITFMVSGRGAALRRPKLPLLVALDAREPDLRVVPEAADPAFVRGAPEPLRLLVDRLHRVQVERRHPRRLRVIHRRDQVRQEAECPPAARRRDHRHVAIVSRRAAHPDARHDLVIAIDQHHLAGVHQRIVIRVVVADAVPRMPVVRVLPLRPRREISRARKCRDGAIARQDGVAAAMVEMQMAVDDDVDRLGIDPVRRRRRPAAGSCSGGSAIRSRARGSSLSPAPVSIRIVCSPVRMM